MKPPRHLILEDTVYTAGQERWESQLMVMTCDLKPIKEARYLLALANRMNDLVFDAPTVGPRFKYLPGDTMLGLIGLLKAKRARRNPCHRP